MPNIPGAVTDFSRIRGETISFKRGGDSLPGYLATPSQPGNHPGIVVIHEAFGLVEHIRDIARRFANIGSVTIARSDYQAPTICATRGATKVPLSISLRPAPWPVTQCGLEP